MISWGAILSGALLSGAIAAASLLALGERRPVSCWQDTGSGVVTIIVD